MKWRLLPLFSVAVLAAVGCSGADEPSDEEAAAVAASRVPVDPGTAGVIRGTVTLTGTPPEPREVPLGSEAACAASHDGPVHFNTIMVQDSKLQNAFVWVKEGLEGYAYEPSSEEVVVDQRGCIYEPRVVGVQVKQPLTFVNSDTTNHNVHTVPKKNRGTNFSMPKQGMRTTKTFKKQEVMVKTKCDVHPWMGAWIGVVRHSGFAVSSADGTYEITGLPPGDYLLEVWHEKLGDSTQRVTLSPSGEVTVDFSFQAP